MDTRVKGAVLIGFALVAAAFVLARYGVGPNTPTAATDTNEQAVTITAPTLRPYIPETDSNGDGIPDWQELLDDTEPLALEETAVPYEPPDTLTEQFAQEFFEDYLRNRSFGEFARDPQELVDQASDKLVAQAQDALFTERNIRIIPGDPAAIRAHANGVARILQGATAPPGTRNEMVIVQDALNQNDANVLTELAPIIDGYDAIMEGMLQLTVPEPVVKEHLDLLNAVQAVRNSIDEFQSLFSDPLATLLRVQRYEDDVAGLAAALQNLFGKALQLGDGFGPNDPVTQILGQ
jgi:hypothetical protein